MEWTAYLPALAGGALIGVAAALVLSTIGRVAGVAGIAARAMLHPGDRHWRLAFLVGLIGTGAVWASYDAAAFQFAPSRSMGALVAAGLLVGFGTRLGNGCTSGHGVCGLARLSRRSLVATCTFMGTAIATVALIRGLFGGAL